MSHSSKKALVFGLCGLFLLVALSPAFAEEETKGGFWESVKGFFSRAVKPVPESAETVVETAQTAGEKVLSDSGEKLSKGDLGGGLVAQPVSGTLETAGTAVSGTGETVASPFTNEEESASEPK